MFFFTASKPQHPNITLRKNIQNPLKACPSSPNCVHCSYHISRQQDLIYRVVLNVLKQMNANTVHKSLDNFTAEAVFKIFFFKDDVSISLEKNKDGTLLHIRSASRKGHYDFGVNRRRINKFIKLMGQKIK